MTALAKYDRLEATGLWRPTPQDQRREVVVSIGDATLVISDMNDQAITHWSLAAVERYGTSNTPAVFHPDGDPAETLELLDSETEMINAIDTLRKAVLKARPNPGRLRWLGATVSFSAVAAAMVLWLPNAVQKHTLSVVPDVTRAKIGEALLTRIERVAGTPCQSRPAAPALKTLALRTNAKELIVLRAGITDSLYLPGGKVLVNRVLVEDFEEPDVVAGYILAEQVRSQTNDSLEAMLDHVGLRATFTLLTTGNVPSAALDDYAEAVLSKQRPDVDETALLAAFAAANIRSTPYAKAVDVTGETTFGLIEADPVSGTLTKPLLRDGDWLRLQAICGN
jgi:hypothetical protein|tara:strand:- start:14554 stop:15567 length:1014 start_codon:yes stop_codon:yes gene_type:complete